MHLISAWNHPAFADYARHCNDQWTDALYPLAQEAMRRGYYMPNRNSIHGSRHHRCMKGAVNYPVGRILRVPERF